MQDNLTPQLRAAVDQSLELASAAGHPNVHALHLLAGICVVAPTEDVPNLDVDTAADLIAQILPEFEAKAGALHPTAQRALGSAVGDVIRSGEPLMDVHDVLPYLTDGTDPACTQFLVAAAGIGPSQSSGQPVSTVAIPKAVAGFVTDMTAQARAGHFVPAVGRDDVVERVLVVLGRRGKNNPVLTGEAGVGKTAVAEEVARRIAAGLVPDELASSVVWSVDIGGLIAGTAMRGDWEAKVKALLDAVTSSPVPVILFIDELHALVDAGQAKSGGTSAKDLLKPALARSSVKVMGATTTDEYRKHVMSDAALERRFSPVEVPEPSDDVAVAMLRSWAVELERHHQVRIEPDAVVAAVRMSAAVHDRSLPDRGIDVLDEACARVVLARLRSRSHSDSGGDPEDSVVNTSVVADVVSAMTGLPVGVLGMGPDTELLTLPQRVSAKVVGQRHAVEEVCRVITRRRAGVSTLDRPGSLLLVGPTGVGKTHLVKSVAEEVYGPDPVGKNRLIVVDCSEVASDASLSTLIGAPPGYVGHDDGVSFLERVRRNPDSIILFDEIDKASPAVYDMLLQVLDEGRVTDGAGRVIRFDSAVVVLTSNHGAHAAGKMSGFASGAATMQQATMSAVTEAFRPEFLNRLDAVVVFEHLKEEDAAAIAALEVAALVNTAAGSGVTIRVHDEVIEVLAAAGMDPRHGARGMRSVVSDVVTDLVADVVIEGGKDVTVYVQDGAVCAQQTPALVCV